MVESEAILTDFNFRVAIASQQFSDGLGVVKDSTGAFSEVSGLEMSLEKKEIQEGGYNRGARQLIGKMSNPEIVLKRGLTLDAAFWEWIQSCVNGTFPLPYVSGTVTVFRAGGKKVAQSPHAEWKFRNGIVTRVRTSDLAAAGSSSVPIEELHISHEGLERTIASPQGGGA